MEVCIIAAVAENGVIGADGELPWHYPEDMRHFREVTTGELLVMGRTTYEGIAEKLGGPLPDRTTIVLSFDAMDLPEGAVNANSVDAVFEIAERRGADCLFVAGGASVYEQFLPMADRMVLTEIRQAYEGDTRFPAVDWGVWSEMEREDAGELSFVEYRRTSS